MKHKIRCIDIKPQLKAWRYFIIEEKFVVGGGLLSSEKSFEKLVRLMSLHPNTPLVIAQLPPVVAIPIPILRLAKKMTTRMSLYSGV